MVTAAAFRKMALSFEQAVELPHFELTSYRVNKKIFATLDKAKHRIMVKLPLNDQSSFCVLDSAAIYPVPNSWGAKGATYVELKKVGTSMLKDALRTAYCSTAPKKLSSKYL